MIALQINGIIGMPLAVSNLVYEPKISELYTKGNFIKLQKLIEKFKLWLAQ